MTTVDIETNEELVEHVRAWHGYVVEPSEVVPAHHRMHFVGKGNRKLHSHPDHFWKDTDRLCPPLGPEESG